MSADSRDAGHDEVWKCIRTILVPPDLVAVPRRSPPRIRKRTPWHPQPDGQVATERVGQREWFSDRLFVESQDGHAPAGYSTSVTIHVAVAAALLVYLIVWRVDPPMILRPRAQLMMPVVVAALTVVEVPGPRTVEARQPAVAEAVRSVPAAAPPPSAAVDSPSPAAPIAEPSGIAPESGAEKGGSSGIDGGVAGGVPGGVVGGLPGGAVQAPGGPGPARPAAVRVGVDMKAPRKIKDARPIYPESALSSRGRASVFIEAIIGPDGKVEQASVLHSSPPFDQAALDAVRKWEYEPPMLNGLPVAVVMTVIVNFALQ